PRSTLFPYTTLFRSNIIDAIGMTTDKDRRKHIVTLVHTELAMHSKAEEEVFYRPLRERLADDEIIHHSFDDHDEIDRLLAKLQRSEEHTSELQSREN